MHRLILLMPWNTAKQQMKSGNTGSNWAPILPVTPFILSQITVGVMSMESE